MKQQRRFAIAPSFLRLIRRERPGTRIVEGHFADQPDRRSHVRLEGDRCELVLETVSDGAVTGEERTEVSRAQGEVLLDVCAGKVSYERMRVDAGEGPIVVVDRYLSPSTAGVVRLVFDSPEEATAFKPPAWCGPELAAQDPIEPRALALGGRPKPFEGPFADTALDALIDVLDGLAPRFAGRGRDDAVLSALKRLAQPAPQGAPQAASQSAAAASQPKSQPSQTRPVTSAPRPTPTAPTSPAQQAAHPAPVSEEPPSGEDSALFEPMEPSRPAKPGNGSAGRPT